MTEDRPPKKRRWSKRAVRATAWTAGATVFLSATSAFVTTSPPVATSQATSPIERTGPRTIVQRRIVKRIVIVDPTVPSPVVIPRSDPGSLAPPVPAPVPAPATTGGS